MDTKTEKILIEDVKPKVAKFLYRCQNQSIGNGYCGWYVHSYVDLLWQFMGLDSLQRKYIKPACKEMIQEGHLIAEKEPDEDFAKENKTRISLTDLGIFYYFYKKH